MKVFISADIEGITTTTIWEDCDPKHPFYAKNAAQMTKEVVAACEGAIAAGADEIVIKDAHGPAINIDIFELPECVKLQREWSGNPYSMVEGIDKSFDACMFVGYHSAAGRNGNPLSHTYSGRNNYIKVNGRYASEFMLFSYCAAHVGVPSVFLSGDKMLCDDYADLHPSLVTVPVKEGNGAMVLHYSPKKTLRMIREESERALKQDLSKARISLPKHFDIEISCKEHIRAKKISFFPGVKQVSDQVVTYSTDNWDDAITTIYNII